MQEVEFQPTKQRIVEVEQKVKDLEHEVEEVKNASIPSEPTEIVKQQVQDLKSEPTKSPRKLLTIILIVGAAIILIGVLALFITSGAILRLAVLVLLVVLLLNGRVGYPYR